MPRGKMSVGELKAAIKDIPDDWPVLVPFADHQYRHIGSASPITALRNHNVVGGWIEDHGEDVTPEAENGKRYDALFLI